MLSLRCAPLAWGPQLFPFLCTPFSTGYLTTDRITPYFPPHVYLFFSGNWYFARVFGGKVLDGPSYGNSQARIQEEGAEENRRQHELRSENEADSQLMLVAPGQIDCLVV